MNIKSLVFFILWLTMIAVGVWAVPKELPAGVDARQIVVEFSAVAGLILFWVPEMVWRRLKR